MDLYRYAVEGLEHAAENDPKFNDRRREFYKALLTVRNKRAVLELEEAFNATWIRAVHVVASEAVESQRLDPS